MAGKHGLSVKVEHRLVLFAVVELLVEKLLLLVVAFGKIVTVASARTVVERRFEVALAVVHQLWK